MKKLLWIFVLAVVPVPSFAQSHSVALSWTASADAGSTYNIYRLSGSCPTTLTGFTKLTATPVTSTTYTDSTVSVGSYCYYATAVFNSLESVPSNAVPAVILPSSPQALKVTSSQ